MEAISTEIYRGVTIEVIPDYDSESPRNWSNIGTVCNMHPSYSFGDFNLPNKPESFSEHCENVGIDINDLIVLPIYAHIHSGIVLSTNKCEYPFTCPWDTCQIGLIYCAKSDYVETVKVKDSPGLSDQEIIEMAKQALESEVETLSTWLSGGVVGYSCWGSIEGLEPFDDSCWGFYDEAYMLKEVKANIDSVYSEKVKPILDNIKAITGG